MSNTKNFSHAVSPDTSITKSFLAALGIGDSEADFRVIPDQKSTCHLPATLLRGSFSALEDQLVKSNELGAGIFIIVNECDGQGQKAANVLSVRALFADLDKVPLSNIDRFPLDPTLIAETSPGKFHAYWVCNGVSVGDFKSLQKRLAGIIGSDPAVCDPPRCMRLPGFFHQKDPSRPHQVRIDHLNSIKPYACAEIRKALSEAEGVSVVAGPQAPSSPTYALGAGHPDGERTAALCSLAGQLIHAGLSDDDALDKLKAWNKLNTPPLDELKVYKTFHSIRAADDAKVSALDRQLRSLDARYRIIISGGKAVIRDERTSDFLSPQAFREFNRHLQHEGKLVALIWMARTVHRYPELVFDPNLKPGGHSKSVNNKEPYNLWRGFGVDQIPGSVDLYLQHVEKVICDGDSDVFEYVINYLAHMVQKPTELPEVALVLKGIHGVGKGRFLAPFKKILGRHYKEFTQLNQVFGQFNAHLADVLMMHANEATWGGNKQQEGALKAMITEPETAYEAKFRGIEILPNYKRVIISSNNDWVVPAALTERRFLVLNSNDKYRGDRAYFQALSAEIENGGCEALLEYLLMRNISGFDPRNKPVTRGLTDQKLQSICSVGAWLHDALQNGAFYDSGLYGSVTYRSFIATAELLDSYKNYAKNDPYRPGRVATSQQLVSKIREYLPVQRVRKKIEASHRDPTEKRGLTFPSLVGARRAFEAKVEGPVDWEDDPLLEDDAAASPATQSSPSDPRTAAYGSPSAISGWRQGR